MALLLFFISLLNFQKSTRLQVIYSFLLLVTSILLSKLFCFLLFSIILSFQTTVIFPPLLFPVLLISFMPFPLSSIFITPLFIKTLERTMRMAGVRAEVPKPWVMKILQWVASPQKKHKNWYGVCLYLQIYVFCKTTVEYNTSVFNKIPCNFPLIDKLCVIRQKKYELMTGEQNFLYRWVAEVETCLILRRTERDIIQNV